MNVQPAANKNLTSIETTHGKVWLLPKESDDDLKLKPIKKKATGFKAVAVSAKYAISEAGLLRGTLPMLQLNQKQDGIDCPGCAWPDPDGTRSAFEFCENGAKAVAHESDRRRIDAEFFAKYSVNELSTHTGYWLEQQGRLTEPMVLKENATHYTPISWDAAYDLIADELNRLESPDRASFYTSGKATNEAAFALQLFVRQFGTNNLPDCSNMCHESSGRAMTQMLGFGKGTVTLEDFEKAELVLVVGQNPGTNHPRQLNALQDTKRNGGKIISVNPMPETGLMAFMDPQEVRGMLGFPTKLTDLFLQVKVNGDIPLFKGIIKKLVEWDDAEPGAAIDHAFVDEFTANLEELLADVRSADWDTIVSQSGVAREAIEEAAAMIRDAEKMIICWCLGVTQHVNGTENVREMMNLLLLRGAIGKPGAGACCVRGHSNVQGDRTMGVWEKLPDKLRDKLRETFDFEPPAEEGLDSQRTAVALHNGEIDVFVSLGGNFLMAMPDTRYGAEALSKTRLNVRIGTKLNRADLVAGGQSLILPCLGRTELDERTDASGEKVAQLTTTENAMGVVQTSTGKYTPASPNLRNEVAIVCEIAAKTLNSSEASAKKTKVDWLAWANDYDLIREGIAAVIPGCEDYNRRSREPGGFYLPNNPRLRIFDTPNGKANFSVNAIPQQTVGPDQFALTTVRSHDQFNTTIYGPHDRYRGILNARRVVMMNADDMQAQGLKSRDRIAITSHSDSEVRQLSDFQIVEYSIPRGCVAMYYPEANPLIPMSATDEFSNCPSFKHTVVSISKLAQ